MNGIQLIDQERQRQINNDGWTFKHDDKHTDGSLALAAALYATPQKLYIKDMRNRSHVIKLGDSGARIEVPCTEKLYHDPWPDGWVDKRKKHNRMRCLVIAGALIAAEIDRLERLEDEK